MLLGMFFFWYTGKRPLKHCNREKRTYNKRNAAYWEDGITENTVKADENMLERTPSEP